MIYNKQKILDTIVNSISEYIKNTGIESVIVFKRDYYLDFLCLYIFELVRANTKIDVYYNSNANEKLNFTKEVCFSENEYDDVLEFAEQNNSLICYSFCINDGIILKSFNKHKTAADIIPLIELYYSECIDLLNYIFPELKITPIHNDIIEFCHKQELKYQILSNEESPVNNKNWFKYTKDQKEKIAYLHERYKKTKHKNLLSRCFYPAISHLRV